MKHYYENLDGWFNFSDLYRRMVETYKDKSHFVEIGSWLGKSSVYMGVEIFNSNKNIKFDCIDIWLPGYAAQDEPRPFETFLKNIEPLKNIISYHKMSSMEACNLYKNESIDFIYIDGSHEYNDVKNDLIHWYPKVKYNGTIAGHDYNNPCGVKQAVDEFFINKNFVIDDVSWMHYKI